MKIVFYILLVLVGLILIILFIGLLLPKERSATLSTEYKASPEEVYKALINNEDYSYRTDLAEINIIEKNGDFEVWDEVSTTGNRIRFRTTLKEPYSRYEFDIIEANGFTGHWSAQLSESDKGGTIYTSTETVYIRNPFIRVMSYLFMDLTKFMYTFQEDLRRKVDG